MWRASVLRLILPCSAVIAMAALPLALLSGCRGGGGAGSPDFFPVAFDEDGRANLFRDQVLTIRFTTQVDPASVDHDTLQVFGGTVSNPVPFSGRYEVEGTIVRFHPVVEEPVGGVPLNPFGFGENTTYHVRIPSILDTPTPLKVLRDRSGQSLVQSLGGSFSTGREYVPRPDAPNPMFALWAEAVTATPTPDDDVLTFIPAPDPLSPPRHPGTGQPDLRAEQPSDVRVHLNFTEVMMPRSFRTQFDGNVVLEFLSPGTSEWVFIPAEIQPAPDGRTYVLTAATPLAHRARPNEYRIVIDQSRYPIQSRAGKRLIEAVDRPGPTPGRPERSPVTSAQLRFWTALDPNESGPLVSAVLPLESFARNSAASDSDVVFGPGRVRAGPVVQRFSADTTPCQLPGTACQNTFREPLSQSIASPNPTSNSVGPSKVMFLFQEYQHAKNRAAYKLPDAEALVEMYWSPFKNFVIQATYPKLHIHVMASNRNSTIATSPAALPYRTYLDNFDISPPGEAVRDGATPYVIPGTQVNLDWYPWKFERPFTRYRSDRGLVWMAWTEQGGQVDQNLKWYAQAAAPVTRLFNAPSAAVNPSVGTPGDHMFYWTRFEFKRMRSLAVTNFYRMTASAQDKPKWHSVVITPEHASLPGGSHYTIEYRGARFANYVKREVGLRTFWEGVGAPLNATAWTQNIQNLDGFPAVAVRIVFESNINAPTDLPFIDGIAFSYGL